MSLESRAKELEDQICALKAAKVLLDKIRAFVAAYPHLGPGLVMEVEDSIPGLRLTNPGVERRGRHHTLSEFTLARYIHSHGFTNLQDIARGLGVSPKCIRDTLDRSPLFRKVRRGTWELTQQPEPTAV